MNNLPLNFVFFVNFVGIDFPGFLAAPEVDKWAGKSALAPM
jgi:hypothetical protein